MSDTTKVLLLILAIAAITFLPSAAKFFIIQIVETDQVFSLEE